METLTIVDKVSKKPILKGREEKGTRGGDPWSQEKEKGQRTNPVSTAF